MKSANFGIYVVSCYYAVTFGKFPSSLATKIPIIKVGEVVTFRDRTRRDEFSRRLEKWVKFCCLEKWPFLGHSRCLEKKTICVIFYLFVV